MIGQHSQARNGELAFPVICQIGGKSADRHPIVCNGGKFARWSRFGVSIIF
jgi:hypothetical protein